jgi:hypothetical protein
VELQGRVDQVRRSGRGIVGISYDSVATLADFSTRRGITFPLLSDAGSTTIKRYGIFNTTVTDTSNFTYGIPFPGTFIVDASGTVTSRFFEAAYQERDTISSVMVRIGGHIEAPATKVAASHVALTTYSTDQVAAPGTHFSLVLDAAPERRVHVYAPGVAGYRPIALTVQPQPGLLIRRAQYPKPEDYFFKPLNEHVAVYQRPFRIVQDLAIDASAQAAPALKDRTSLTIHATLEYQACDDKVCFIPQSVPLSWTIALRPLDRERVKPQ